MTMVHRVYSSRHYRESASLPRGCMRFRISFWTRNGKKRTPCQRARILFHSTTRTDAFSLESQLAPSMPIQDTHTNTHLDFEGKQIVRPVAPADALPARGHVERPFPDVVPVAHRASLAHDPAVRVVPRLVQRPPGKIEKSSAIEQGQVMVSVKR